MGFTAPVLLTYLAGAVGEYADFSPGKWLRRFVSVTHAEGIDGGNEGAVGVWVFALGGLVAVVAERDEVRRIVEALDIHAGRNDVVDFGGSIFASPSVGEYNLAESV